MDAIRTTIINTVWKILERGSLKDLTVQKVAKESHLFESDIYNLCPTSVSFILLLWSDIEEKAHANFVTVDLSPHDILFETIMNHLDVLLPNRQAAIKLIKELQNSPCWLVNLKPYATRWSRQTLIHANIQIENFLGTIKIEAFSAFCFYILNIWSNDQTADYSETMTALDQGLKKLEEWKETVKSFSFLNSFIKT